MMSSQMVVKGAGKSLVPTTVSSPARKKVTATEEVMMEALHPPPVRFDSRYIGNPATSGKANTASGNVSSRGMLAFYFSRSLFTTDANTYLCILPNVSMTNIYLYIYSLFAGTKTTGCLVRNFNVWGTCWDGLKRVTCYPDRVYVTKCGDSDGQDWQFVLVGDDETLIKSSSSDNCLERSGTDVKLRDCDKDVPGQRFFAPNGSLDGYRFELSQRSVPGLCLNQDHHPKNAEYGMYACTNTLVECGAP
jgi:hypothetical protein